MSHLFEEGCKTGPGPSVEMKTNFKQDIHKILKTFV